MIVRLGIVGYIESAHKVGEGPLHGHNFKVEIIVEGEYSGGKMDFHKLRDEVNKVLKELDHKNLNEILEEPTVENIGKFIVERLRKKLPVKIVRVWETENRFCEIIV